VDDSVKESYDRFPIFKVSDQKSKDDVRQEDNPMKDFNNAALEDMDKPIAKLTFGLKIGKIGSKRFDREKKRVEEDDDEY